MEELLAPIPGDNPSGVELRYEPLFDQIKEARRDETDLPPQERQRSEAGGLARGSQACRGGSEG